MQILVNLIDNSIKFTGKDGKIKLIIAEKTIFNEKYICIQVEDNGRGIE